MLGLLGSYPLSGFREQIDMQHHAIHGENQLLFWDFSGLVVFVGHRSATSPNAQLTVGG